MPTAEQLDTYQSAQVGLVALASEELEDFWRTLDVEDAKATTAALEAFLPTLTDRYGSAAAAAAADFYDDLRADAPRRQRFIATVAPTLPVEQIRAQVRYAAGHLFGGIAADTLTSLQNILGKDVLQPGWNTIVESTAADPDAVGWHRETRSSESYGGGCGFCKMLAGRGGVYKRSSARFAAHGKCKCVAYPSWDKDAKEVPVEAYKASERPLSDYWRRATYKWIETNTPATRRRF